MNDTMGSRAEPIQHRVQTSNNNKNPSISKLHYWIHHAQREPNEQIRIMDNTNRRIIDKRKRWGQSRHNLTKGDILKYKVQLQFPATSNEAEYEAILIGLRIAKSMEAKNILLKSDSRLVIRQIKEDYEVKK